MRSFLREALPSVEAAVRSAIVDVERQPEYWPVLLGHRFEPFQQEPGEPIFEPASRQVLLKFLHAVLAEVELAMQRGHYLHWAAVSSAPPNKALQLTANSAFQLASGSVLA